MLEVRNLKKTYRTKGGLEHQALKGINLRFESSGMVFILGKSGSGKSTFLNVVSGLDSFDSGEILICGRSTDDFAARDYDSYRNTYLGFIFQEYNILNDFTVGENISLALELQGRKANDEDIERLLGVVGIEGLRDRKPSELSGGQKQRMAIARALIKNPEIIFADEPTGNLDSASGEQIFDFLTELAKTKLIIVVSHDRESAFRYGDRIIELADGEVIYDGKKDDNGAFHNTNAIKIEKNKSCTLIRSKLPAKAAWRIASHNIGQKKLKLAVMLLLIVLSVSIFGFTEILSRYSMVDSTVASFSNAGIDNIILRQGGLGEYFDNFERSNKEITEETIDSINNKFPELSLGKYYPMKNINISLSGGNYLPTSINGVVVSSKENIAQLGFKLIGSFPERDDPSIVVTDYILFMCLSKNPSLLGLDTGDLLSVISKMDFDESNAEELEAKTFMQVIFMQILQSGKDDSELLNSLLRLATDGEDISKNIRLFTVLWEKLVQSILDSTDRLNFSKTFLLSGVLITGFENYIDLLQMTKTEQRQDERVVTFSHLFSNYYSVFYTSEAFLDFWYSEQVLTGSLAVDTRYMLDGTDILENVTVEYNKAWLAKNPDAALKENEIIISDLLFQDIFGGLAVFETDSTESIYSVSNSKYRYTYKYSTYNDRQKIYGEDYSLKVVGVFKFYDTYRQNQDKDDENDVHITNNSRYMIAHENVFMEAADVMMRCGGLYLSLPESNGDRADLLKHVCDSTKEAGLMMYHFTSVSDIIYTMDDTLFIFITVFEYLSYIMGAFSILLLVNFMSASVMGKKRDIGILRALGARGLDVSKIFIYEASVIGLLSTALSCVGMTAMTYLVNFGIKRNIMKIFQNDMVSNLSLLTLSVVPYIIVVLASAFLVYFSTLIPAQRISKMKPVDAIKKS